MQRSGFARNLGHSGIHIHSSGFYSPNSKEVGYDTGGSYNPLDWTAGRKAFVQAAFAYLNQHPEVPPILTIACFNEWTEGHYLLPDNRFGFGRLDALAEALEIAGTADLHGR